ncbi:J domain-containing protein [Myxacorys almedinensis]|uniref:DnaJ domain-containing protein n=1 Tax=Myxacorys almedinensis A TaxID=2690445 RepID=A0A8J7Z397_9CYAN|nr:DnaJ domain-containing protein [Myxacorys almedinensis]NDJ17416.1 DnaJ domain-containing protein [Myxacorys almedinensis A]
MDVKLGDSLDEVKRAYKELVQVWHPDRFRNNPKLEMRANQKLKEINAAYDYVCEHYDPAKTNVN